MAELADKKALKNLLPIGELNNETFHEIAQKAFVESIPPKRQLFKVGDLDKKLIFVLEGELVLTSKTGAKITVAAGSTMARHPVANHQPRHHTAIAKTALKITRIDIDLMDILLGSDQMQQVEAGELTLSNSRITEGDWMSKVLASSKVFKEIPPNNIFIMFQKMEEMKVVKGQEIIKQGDTGEYYYLIREGSCQVTRSQKSGKTVVLANLKSGDCFGEEALISESSRNANVVMSSNGILMKLSKQDFELLLKEPVVKTVNGKEAADMLKEGDTALIDVRLESEHKNFRIKGSTNIPLFLLRMKMSQMPRDKRYILYCDTGRRSSVAAFLLNQQGLRAYSLIGGVSQGDS